MLIRTKIGKNGIIEENKINLAIQRLRNNEPDEGYYLGFSGGKDSIVAERLCKLAGVKYDAHYNLTTADPPEIVYFIRNNYPKVIFEKSNWTMWTLIPHKKMPPTRIVRYCCEELKEFSGEGRVVVTGIRWGESYKRSGRKVLERDNRGKDKTYLNPIIDWSENDVWDFIHEQNLDYCKLYDQGYARLGCIGCPMAGGEKQKEEFQKYPKYKQAYIRAFYRMIEARKEAGLETNWTTGEEVMEWWLNGKIEKIHKRQMGWDF